MSAIAALRSQTTKRARTVFTLLAIAWMSVLLQPCVIAASLSSANSTGNAAILSGEINSYSDAPRGGGQCACPQRHHSHSGCCDAGQIGTESELLKPGSLTKFEADACEQVSSLFQSPSACDLVADWQLRHYPADHKSLQAGPALNVRHCVYLK